MRNVIDSLYRYLVIVEMARVDLSRWNSLFQPSLGRKLKCQSPMSYSQHSQRPNEVEALLKIRFHRREKIHLRRNNRCVSLTSTSKHTSVESTRPYREHGTQHHRHNLVPVSAFQIQKTERRDGLILRESYSSSISISHAIKPD